MTNPPTYLFPSLLRRSAAMLYDSLLLMGISIGYGALAVALYTLLTGVPEAGEKIDWGNWKWLVFAGWVGVILLFFCFFWHKSGQTLGMRAWRLHIRQSNQQLPDWTQCLWRCCAAALSLGLLGGGYFWSWFDPHRQTLHDRLSKTQTLLLPKEDNKIPREQQIH